MREKFQTVNSYKTNFSTLTTNKSVFKSSQIP